MYTIFKNLTIILIVCTIYLVSASFSNRSCYRKAYGEMIWFGGRVTGLTFVSFIFMVSFACYTDANFIFIPVIGNIIHYCFMDRRLERARQFFPHCEQRCQCGFSASCYRRCAKPQHRIPLDARKLPYECSLCESYVFVHPLQNS